jgi:quercetin dioxygenase-like cupin family protein
MKEVEEKFSTYLDRIERLEGQFHSDSIILSTSLNTKEFLIDGDDERIVKEPILWRLYQHNMFYIVTVPAGTVIQKHKHGENVFRFIAQGSLTLNKKITIVAGTWFVVRANTPYQITTEEGYVSLTAYTSICQTNRGAFGSHLVKRVKSSAAKKSGNKA